MGIKKHQPLYPQREARRGYGDPLFVGNEVSRIWRPNGELNLELLHGRYGQFAFAPHFHPVAAFGVVEAGAMRTVCRGETHLALPETVILFNPGEVHAPASASVSGWAFRMFYPDTELLQKLSRELLWLDAPCWFLQPFVHNPSLARKLRLLHRHYERYRPTLESESLLAASLAELTRYTSSTIDQPRGAVSHVSVTRARDYLQAHCHENVSLNRLAAAAGLSPYHLLRTFRTHVGLTPHAYLYQARIERARVMLRKGYSLAETAFQTGFVDQSHFTRHFKRMMGVTPGQYLPLVRADLARFACRATAK